MHADDNLGPSSIQFHLVSFARHGAVGPPFGGRLYQDPRRYCRRRRARARSASWIILWSCIHKLDMRPRSSSTWMPAASSYGSEEIQSRLARALVKASRMKEGTLDERREAALRAQHVSTADRSAAAIVRRLRLSQPVRKSALPTSPVIASKGHEEQPRAAPKTRTTVAKANPFRPSLKEPRRRAEKPSPAAVADARLARCQLRTSGAFVLQLSGVHSQALDQQTPLQSPPMQSPPLQTPPMQSPPMQSPPMQSPPLQSPVHTPPRPHRRPPPPASNSATAASAVEKSLPRTGITRHWRAAPRLSIAATGFDHTHDADHLTLAAQRRHAIPLADAFRALRGATGRGG